MKVAVDCECSGCDFEITETQKDVICNDIKREDFDCDMKRRLKWILDHKYTRCYGRLKKEWEPKLIARGAESLPTDPDAFAQLVFSQPDYKDRSTRDLEAEQV